MVSPFSHEHILQGSERFGAKTSPSETKLPRKSMHPFGTPAVSIFRGKLCIDIRACLYNTQIYQVFYNISLYRLSRFFFKSRQNRYTICVFCIRIKYRIMQNDHDSTHILYLSKKLQNLFSWHWKVFLTNFYNFSRLIDFIFIWYNDCKKGHVYQKKLINSQLFFLIKIPLTWRFNSTVQAYKSTACAWYHFIPITGGGVTIHVLTSSGLAIVTGATFAWIGQIGREHLSMGDFFPTLVYTVIYVNEIQLTLTL